MITNIFIISSPPMQIHLSIFEMFFLSHPIKRIAFFLQDVLGFFFFPKCFIFLTSKIRIFCFRTFYNYYKLYFISEFISTSYWYIGNYWTFFVISLSIKL